MNYHSAKIHKEEKKAIRPKWNKFNTATILLVIVFSGFILILASLINNANLSQNPKAREPIPTGRPAIPTLHQQIDLNSEYQLRASQGDPNIAIIESCHILFWNIVPPTVPVEQARVESEKALGQVQNQVLQGKTLKEACEIKAAEAVSTSKPYLKSRFSVRTALLDQPWFNPQQNPGINERVKQLAIGDLLFFPLHDGGYTSDGISENDTVYLAGYRLLKRIR